MEQIRFNRFLSHFDILPAFILVCVTVGCKSKDPNPELRDPIYLDIQSTLADVNADLAGQKTFLELGTEEEKVLSPGDPQLAVIRRDIRKAKLKILAAEQKAKYLEIRLERRRLESKIAYERSLVDEAVQFPDMHEYQAFLAHKKLRNASSNWNERVPRLKDRIDRYVRKMNGEPEPEKKGDAGGS